MATLTATRCEHCGIRVSALHKHCPTCTFPIQSRALQTAWLAGFNAPQGSKNPYQMLKINGGLYVSTPGGAAWALGRQRAAHEAKIEEK